MHSAASIHPLSSTRLCAAISGAIWKRHEKIGGNDIDGNFIPERAVGDPIALRALYSSGLMNSGGGGLANVPILHSRTYTDSAGDIHDRERDFTIRARLEKEGALSRLSAGLRREKAIDFVLSKAQVTRD